MPVNVAQTRRREFSVGDRVVVRLPGQHEMRSVVTALCAAPTEYRVRLNDCTKRRVQARRMRPDRRVQP